MSIKKLKEKRKQFSRKLCEFNWGHLVKWGITTNKLAQDKGFVSISEVEYLIERILHEKNIDVIQESKEEINLKSIEATKKDLKKDYGKFGDFRICSGSHLEMYYAALRILELKSNPKAPTQMFSFEGTIGAGKTMLARSLQERYNKEYKKNKQDNPYNAGSKPCEILTGFDKKTKQQLYYTRDKGIGKVHGTFNKGIYIAEYNSLEPKTERLCMIFDEKPYKLTWQDIKNRNPEELSIPIKELINFYNLALRNKCKGVTILSISNNSIYNYIKSLETLLSSNEHELRKIKVETTDIDNQKYNDKKCNLGMINRCYSYGVEPTYFDIINKVHSFLSNINKNVNMNDNVINVNKESGR